jgi:hypothetical protein
VLRNSVAAGTMDSVQGLNILSSSR